MVAASEYLLSTGTKANSFDVLNVEYSGNKVECDTKIVYKNNIYLSECTVNGKEIKDKKTEDGWYHYNNRDLTNEEYIDMYGKALEKALKEYHDTNNSYPDDYNSLTLDYKGKNVICDSSINYDGSIYLTNCSVAGNTVKNTNNEDGYYHYGRIKYYPYNVGDKVTYNGLDYYVIENSNDAKTTVKLLKAEPLAKEEIEYLNLSEITNDGSVHYGTTVNYAQSEIKYVVDSWKATKAPLALEARLITYDELTDNLGYEKKNQGTIAPSSSGITPSWVYSPFRYCWTMSQYGDSSREVWYINSSGLLISGVISYWGLVRPVIVLDKTVLNK